MHTYVFIPPWAQLLFVFLALELCMRLILKGSRFGLLVRERWTAQVWWLEAGQVSAALLLNAPATSVSRVHTSVPQKLVPSYGVFWLGVCD